MKEKTRKILFISMFLFFLFLAILVCFHFTEKIDLAVSSFVATFHTPWLTSFFLFITEFGYIRFLLLFLILILVCFHRERFAYLLPIHLAIVTLLNFLLKQLFARPRPEFSLITETGFSFPSGHAMVTMAFYGYLLYVVVKLVKKKWLRNSLIVLFVSIIFLVGLSRIYLGVHYVTDVLAGYSISLVYLFLVTKIPFFSLEETS